MNEENTEIKLQNKDGEILASSREVAEKFNKKHKNVLQSIENLVAKNSATKNMFIKTTYENRGKQYKEYLMTRDGFSLLVMGFTGNEALEWKLKYIDAFNRMEKTISTVLSEKDAAILSIVNAQDDISRALAVSNFENVVTKPLKLELKKNEPLYNFAKQVAHSEDLIDMGKMAKLLKEENIPIGRNKLFEWLRNKKILMSNNVPYQKYIDKELFKVKETVKETHYGNKIIITTLITGKGQVYISNKLKKEYKIN